MDAETVSDLRARVALMRELGIRRLDMGGYEIEVGEAPAPEAPAPEATSAKDLADLTDGPPEGDDALFWSVSGPLPSEARSSAQPPKE